MYFVVRLTCIYLIKCNLPTHLLMAPSCILLGLLLQLAEYCNESVCPRTYFMNHTSKLYQIVCACCSCGSFLRCDTLCTSGFIDDVTFAHNGPNGGMSILLHRCIERRHCVVVCRLTPLLCNIDCVIIDDAERPD